MLILCLAAGCKGRAIDSCCWFCSSVLGVRPFDSALRLVQWDLPSENQGSGPQLDKYSSYFAQKGILNLRCCFPIQSCCFQTFMSRAIL